MSLGLRVSRALLGRDGGGATLPDPPQNGRPRPYVLVENWASSPLIVASVWHPLFDSSGQSESHVELIQQALLVRGRRNMEEEKV